MSHSAQRFKYRAVREDGTIEHGTTAAESRAAVITLLAARRSMPLDISSDVTTASEPSLLPLREQALGLRALATLISSGLPLAKALAAFAELAPTGWLSGVDEMREGVRQGRTFASALESSNLGLSSVVIGIIRAGETAGRLPTAVKASADMMEFRANSREALLSALAYPLVLTVASLASVTVLLGVVVPRFAAALAETATTLPSSTKALINLAAWIRAALVPATLSLGLALVAWRVWTSMPQGRLRWDRWTLLVPVAGRINHAAATSRFCDALGTLLKSGVPIATALSGAASSLANSHLTARLHTARASVLEGAPLSRALGSNGVITVTAVRLARAGEESGDLTTMLTYAAQIESARVQQLTKNALRLLEPTLILVFGAVVAGITAALLQALYSVRPG